MRRTRTDTRIPAEMSEDQRCRLSKQAGLSIGNRLFCLSGKGKMENQGQVLAFWQAPLSLPPSASLNVVSEFCFCGTGQDRLSLIRFGGRCSVFNFLSGIPKHTRCSCPVADEQDSSLFECTMFCTCREEAYMSLCYEQTRHGALFFIAYLGL